MIPNPIPFIPADSNRYKDLSGLPARPWDLIVLHDMEAPETNKTALNVARWFHSAPVPQTSAHYCVDSHSIVQCVQLRDVAYGAPHANRNGIHIELAGYATQSVEGWNDEFSFAMLELAAELVAKVIRPKTGIPLAIVDAAGLRAGLRGITMHRTVSEAWNPGGHSDPGPNFPIERFVQMCGESFRAVAG